MAVEAVIGAATSSGAPAMILSSTRRASPMSRRRCFGSRMRQSRMSVRRRGGTASGRDVRLTSRVSTAASVSETSSASNRRRPVSISYTTTPKAQMSARLSTARPLACSGAMYAAVPRIMPISVIAGVVMVGDIEALADIVPAGAAAFASPKSSTFTVPSARTLIFAGFRSRWMIPCSCAASRASAICSAMGSVSDSDIGPRAMIVDRSSPSTSSITRAHAPPDSSMPKMPAMFG